MVPFAPSDRIGSDPLGAGAGPGGAGAGDSNQVRERKNGRGLFDESRRELLRGQGGPKNKMPLPFFVLCAAV